MKRIQFLRNSLAAAGFISLPISTLAGKQTDPPQLDKKLVEEFVRVSHSDMDKVKELLAEHPTLLNASYDWKGGDFETGLGASSHVGYKELAQYFIDQGAQANIFTATLFGRMDIVKPMLDFFPQALYAKGPHGLTLLHHADKGGDEALEVKEYLMSLGAKKMQVALY